MAGFHLYLKPNISGVYRNSLDRQKSSVVSITTSKKLPENDFVILAQPGENPLIMPYLFKVDIHVIKQNQINLNLKIEETYSSSLVSAKSLQAHIQQLSQEIREDTIISLPQNLYYLIIGFLNSSSIEISQDRIVLRPPRTVKTLQIPSEKNMLTKIKDHITQRGYFFSEEVIDSFHVSLKTRPFIILTGFSGMGKSKLPQLYAEALGYEKNFLLLPVKPDWSSENHILGFIDHINYIYVQEPLTEILLRAIYHKDELYFVCLDEMNLSRVEDYFVSFLSVMEQDDPQKREINLYSESTKNWLQTKNGLNKDIAGLPTSPLLIPPNIFFIGTVNGGQNTYALSDKVLDRANCLEFHRAQLTSIPQQNLLNGGTQQLPISGSIWQSYKAKSPNEEYYEKLEEMGQILYKAMIGISYRVARQIGLYIANSEGIFTPDQAFDLQVKQRILPLVRGPQVDSALIKNLRDFFAKNNLVRSYAYLEIIEQATTSSFYEGEG